MDKKIIALIRTSTIEQEVDSQKKEVIDYILSDGYSLDDIIVVGGKGASAIKLDDEYLKNIQRVYQLIESGKVKAVYAWSIDRIGRNRTLLHSFRDRLVENCIQLRIKNPNLTLLKRDDEGKLVEDAGVGLAFSLYAEMAMQEMQQKKARFTRARKRNAESGKANGGGRCVPFGYMKDDNGYFIINPDEVELVRLIFELHNNGRYSLNKLALELNERGYLHRGKKFTTYFLRGFIKNTVVIGYSDIHKPKTGWRVRRNYPAIISKDVWEKAQEVLKKNKVEAYKGTKHYYFGCKLMICPECKHHYTTTGLQYRCKLNHAKKQLVEQDLPYCNNNISILTPVLDGILWGLTKQKHLNFILGEKGKTKERNNQQIEINLQKIAALRLELSKLDERRAKWLERLDKGLITDEEADKYLSQFSTNKSKIEKAIVALENENYSLSSQLDSLSELTAKSIVTIQEEISSLWDERAMYELVHRYIKDGTIERIEVDGKSGLLLTFNFYDGTKKEIYYFGRNRKHQIYERGKIDKRLNYAFTDSEGNSYNPLRFERIIRDENWQIIPNAGGYTPLPIEALEAKRIWVAEISNSTGIKLEVLDDGTVVEYPTENE